MRWFPAVLVAASGCSFLLGDSEPPDDADGGSITDGAVTTPDARSGVYAAWGIDIAVPDLTGSWNVTGACTIDTDGQTFNGCGPVTSELVEDQLVITARDIMISGSVTVSGERELIIAAERVQLMATAVITATGEIDPSRPAYCESGLEALVTGGAGGAGFGVVGAPSGSRDNGGAAVSLGSLNQVSRGCPGGSAAGTVAGGGGGIQLIATRDVMVAGRIFAHGAGGSGGAMTGGGGGGGSGGMIVLDSPAIVIQSSAQLAANGGSGGSGGSDSDTGSPGVTDPTSFACTSPGVSIGDGGGGGRGSCVEGGDERAAMPGAAGTIATADGGGGAGYGFIVLHGDADPDVGTTDLSPATTLID